MIFDPDPGIKKPGCSSNLLSSRLGLNLPSKLNANSETNFAAKTGELGP